MQPNFIVVGAMKAGTTSYAAMLRQHPDIFMPEQEVHFFDVDARYHAGLSDYATSFSGHTGEQVVGEKTPTYSYRDDIPGRIAELLPDVKLIWLFRDPVARAYSHYRFFASRGTERLSFEQAIEREKQGRTKHYTMNYIDRSIYVKQVKNYLQCFNSEQMLFLLFEEFMNNPADVMRQSCETLGVDASFDFGPEIPRENVTQMPRSLNLQWFGRQMVRPVSNHVWKILRDANRKSGRSVPLPDEIRQELSSFFAPFNAQLAEETGLNLSIWQQQENGVPVR